MNIALSTTPQAKRLDRKRYQLRFSVIPSEFELRKLIISILVENGLGTDDDDDYATAITAGLEPTITFTESESSKYLEDKVIGIHWDDPREIYFMGKLAVTEKYIRTPHRVLRKESTVHRDGLMEGVELFFAALEKELGVMNSNNDHFAFTMENRDDQKDEGVLSKIYEHMSQVGEAVKSLWDDRNKKQ